MQDETISSWLGSLAAKQSTPGGGAAAALMAATSAALLGMVSIFTTGPKWIDREEQMQKFSDDLATLRTQALRFADEDAKAFGAVSSAYKMSQELESDKVARAVAIQAALKVAAEPPIKTAQLTAQLVAVTKELAEKGNPNVISDVAVAASCAKAALESAIVNIEINKQSIKDPEVKNELSAEVQGAEEAITEFENIFELVRNKINGVSM
jgi:formiminotetrahydrofolate cyclodeaminase